MRRWALARVRTISGMTIAAGAIHAMAGSSMAADIELGRYLSSECTTCHGAAKADTTIPPIHGLDQGHFIEVLKAYRAKTLPNEAMRSVAARLQDEDIAALAAYFAAARPR